VHDQLRRREGTSDVVPDRALALRAVHCAAGPRDAPTSTAASAAWAWHTVQETEPQRGGTPQGIAEDATVAAKLLLNVSKMLCVRLIKANW